MLIDEGQQLFPSPIFFCWYTVMQNILTVSALGFKTIAFCSNPETCFFAFKKNPIESVPGWLYLNLKEVFWKTVLQCRARLSLLFVLYMPHWFLWDHKWEGIGRFLSLRSTPAIITGPFCLFQPLPVLSASRLPAWPATEAKQQSSLSSGEPGYRAKEKETASTIETESYKTRKSLAILVVMLFPHCQFFFLKTC